MLTIRQEQLAILSQLEVDKFERWMLAHLMKFFPKQCAAAGELRLRDMIQLGIQRAAQHRFTANNDVCKYVDLMVVFGRDFDTDRRFPWAKEILSRQRNPRAKMQSLQEAAQTHLTRL
jgi:hypothetical protein